MKNPKMKCYLAHPNEERGTPEIDEITKELERRGVEVVNPFSGEDRLMKEKYNRKNYYPDPPYSLGREIWIKDMRQVIKECDMFLVYAPVHLTGGCGWELCEAYRHHKFIQIISPSRHPCFAFSLTRGNQMYDSIEDWKKFRQLKWKEEDLNGS